MRSAAGRKWRTVSRSRGWRMPARCRRRRWRCSPSCSATGGPRWRRTHSRSSSGTSRKFRRCPQPSVSTSGRKEKPVPVAEAAKDQMQRPGTTVIIYDDFHKPGAYTLADYDAKWSINMLGEMAVEDTRRFDNHSLSISAAPFRTGKDSSVADHGKYLALSKRVFAAPEIGSIAVSMDIAAETPGTVPGHVVHGTYVQSGAPYSATGIQGQQAAAPLPVIDFATGQP